MAKLKQQLIVVLSVLNIKTWIGEAKSLTFNDSYREGHKI